eukprot:scaffold26257_cov100-Isochrysis_galbana.AAC.4
MEAAWREVDDGLREALVTGCRALRWAIPLLHVEHRAAAVHEADSANQHRDGHCDAACHCDCDETEPTVRAAARLEEVRRLIVRPAHTAHEEG